MLNEALKKLGLAEDPFLEEADERYHFATPQLGQRLNLLQHLVPYSELVLVVTGPRGSGKTTLINRLLTDVPEPWRACVIEGTPELTPTDLLLRAVDGFDLPERGVDDLSLKASLQAHAEALRRSAQRAVVFVDEAHHLSTPTLQATLKLGNELAHSGLRVLLFGEPSLAERVGPGSGSPITHLVDIPLLNREQVGHYIQHRLSVAGLTKRSPFTQEAVAAIHKASGGIAGLVNTAARQFLINRASEGGWLPQRLSRPAAGLARRRRFELDRRVLMLAGGMVGGITIAVAAWLLLAPGDSEPLAVETPLPVVPAPPLPPPPERDLPRSYAPGVSAPLPVPPGVRVAPLPAPSAPVPGVTGNAEPAPAPPAAAAESPRATTGPAVDSAEAQRPGAAAPMPGSDGAQRSPPAVAAKPQTPSDGGDGVKGEDWLLAQPAGRFTIQLTGVRDREAALAFIRTHRLGEQAAVFRTVYEGKDWFVAVYGSYPNREQAQAALNGLPPAAKRANPWPRTMQSVHESIGLTRRAR